VPALMPLLASGLALLLGSAVEAATGFGSAMMALPVMEMAFPSHMPALLILLGFPLIVLMVGIERTHIDPPAVAQVSSGLILGTVVAIPVLDLVSGRPLLFARRIGTTDLWLAAVLTIPVVIGFAGGRLLLRRVSRRFLQVAIVAVVAACAVILLLGAV
jgi:uncharacterized membrane protein YfcA